MSRASRADGSLATVTLRLPRLAPEQALALFDVLGALNEAFWNAYEPVIVPLLGNQAGRPEEGAHLDSDGEDDIQY